MIHHPISFSDYKKLAGMSNSLMKHFDQSARHVWNAMTLPQERTDAMLLGNLTDHLLFGTQFDYAVSPFDEYRTKEAKAWRDAQHAAGLEVFKQPTVEAVRLMVHRIKTHPAAAEILKAGRAQVGMDWECEHDGQEMTIKGLSDWVSDEVLCLADLKTTEDASEATFMKHIVNMGYDAQAALYRDLWEWNTGDSIAWAWIVSESKPPHETAVYIASEELLDRGRKVYRARLSKYARVLKTGVWEGYPEAATVIDLPAWAKEREPQ